ncbi:hypothetical protein V6N13_036762 [Hibiscus sabdariffa]|uniref:Endonuclease/exonuclease/phosphatase n=1 Tax=Hibiscus sabdariffa TaxID=183260 RepID=A0ABR2S609_9ROSI
MVIISERLVECWRCEMILLYAPCDFPSQVLLWEVIHSAIGSTLLPWCIGGDFNMTRSSKERYGCSIVVRGMEEFPNFIEACWWCGVPMSGKQFSWFGSGYNCRRLDRF